MDFTVKVKGPEGNNVRMAILTKSVSTEDSFKLLYISKTKSLGKKHVFFKWSDSFYFPKFANFLNNYF